VTAGVRGTGPGPWRRRARWAAVLALIAVGVLWGIQRWVQPIPPRRLVMTTGAPGGTYAAVGERYRQVLAREHISVELRSSSGSVENLRRLQDRSMPVDVGFVQGGIAGPDTSGGLVSLGGIFYTPSWVFYRGPAVLDDLSQLAGMRIAIGPEGSGSQKFALDLLRATGAAGPSTALVELAGRAAAEALQRDEIDAVIVFGSPEGTSVSQLLRAPGIRLMSFTQADAYARLFPALSHVVLPKGALDLAKRLPRVDVHLLAPTTNLVVRDTVHPAVAYLLLDAAVEIHGGEGLLHDAGEFPAPKTQDLRLSEDARRFYKTGRPFLWNYLPFWVATFVDRMALLFIPLLALMIPLIGMSPWIYTWRNRARIYRSYGELKTLEARMAAEPKPARAAEYEATLDRIEASLLQVRVPLAFANEVYTLREHIAMIRRGLTSLDAQRSTSPAGSSGGAGPPSSQDGA
jgi:TRAP-type uncharacterized transport system substrate-binding protein